MKQGSATIGVKSDTHAVLVALKRAANELCNYQKKVIRLDSHSGISVAGLLSDGQILARFLQSECTAWRWDYNQTVPIEVLSSQIQLKLQKNTQDYGRRPFGVGLLLAGYDEAGTHIVKTEPSGEVVETLATAIGARSQSARTYLERHLDQFPNATLQQLIVHALLALRDTLPTEESLNTKNTTIAVVGEGEPFKLIEEDNVQPYLDQLAD